MSCSKSSGFTLLELSIVLVIIGLVAGGILVGRDLIHAAQLRSVVSDIQGYTTAINTFRLKYGALPGDMPNAESIWGSDVSCPNTPLDSVPKTVSCNGNGDGYIGYDNDDERTYSQMYESLRAWQQLANAGLIKGQFTGNGPGLAGWIITQAGVNVPESSIPGGDYSIFFYVNLTGVRPYSGFNGHVLDFGMDAPGTHNINPVLTTADSLSLDTKIDDGRPGTGIMVERPPGSSNPNCATSADPTVAVYNLSYTDIACAPTFKLDF